MWNSLLKSVHIDVELSSDAVDKQCSRTPFFGIILGISLGISLGSPSEILLFVWDQLVNQPGDQLGDHLGDLFGPFSS